MSSEVKFKKLQIARHSDFNLPGAETMTLLVDGTVDKLGYYKKGVIIAQFFGPTIGDAENYAEYFMKLYEKRSR